MTETTSAVVLVTRTVETGSGPITVRPFRLFGDMQVLNEYLPQLGPFFGQLQAGQVLPALTWAEEACMKLVILSTRKSAEEISQLEGEEQLAILVATVEVNLDFFVRRVTPALTGMILSLVPPTPPTARGGRPSFQDMTAKPSPETETETAATSGPTPQTH